MEIKEQSYEEIIERMLGDDENIDKRENSLIWNARAPAAAEIAQLYIWLGVFPDLIFNDSTQGEWLQRRAADFGVDYHHTTKAKRKGVFTNPNDEPFDIPIGSRFFISEHYYVVVNRLGPGQYVLECESFGISGNVPKGDLLPLDNIAGLAHAELLDVIERGEDEEGDESLRSRLYDHVRLPATSGNASHYKIWTREVVGVGDAKIVPLWNGPGTVKVVIIDSDKQPADHALIQLVADHIENVRPIGADVKVVSASSKQINVTAKLVLSAGYTIQSVQSAFSGNLEKYLESIAFVDSYLSHARIGTLLLNVPGVVDYMDLKLNNGNANISLADEEVAILGTVALEV